MNKTTFVLVLAASFIGCGENEEQSFSGRNQRRKPIVKKKELDAVAINPLAPAKPKSADLDKDPNETTDNNQIIVEDTPTLDEQTNFSQTF